jgi:hypothetical protein
VPPRCVLKDAEAQGRKMCARPLASSVVVFASPLYLGCIPGGACPPLCGDVAAKYPPYGGGEEPMAGLPPPPPLLLLLLACPPRERVTNEGSPEGRYACVSAGREFVCVSGPG